MQFEGEIITSRQNRFVVETAKLTDRKAREAGRKFRFDGIKLLIEAAKNHLPLELILLRESCRERVISALREACCDAVFSEAERVLTVADGVFDKISEEKSPEGVICVAKYIDKSQKIITIYNDEDFLRMSGERIVLLESVRDPGNIGTVIRTAAAIGIDRLILSADCADIYNPKAVRASMGTLFNQSIDRTDHLPQVVEGLQRAGRRVFAAALDPQAVRLGSFRPAAGDCVVIGNEGHGLSAELLAACRHKVYIPMSGRAESFNAAIAAGILMWEFSAPTAAE